MQAYDEEKCLLDILTLYYLSVTQGQGQKRQIFTVQAFIIT